VKRELSYRMEAPKRASLDMAKVVIETRRKANINGDIWLTFYLFFIFLEDIHRFVAWVARNIPKEI
jgi:hypothetical protein